MNALIIADDDGIKHQLPVTKVDVLISCGDLADDVILHAATLCSAQRIFAVKGNHDSAGPFPAPIMDLQDRKSVV